MIVDSFLYFNEKELADLRIKYLNDVVDSFVVIEANVTHQGKAKQWNFSSLLENELKQFKGKIKYHQLKIDINKVKNDEGQNIIVSTNRIGRIDLLDSNKAVINSWKIP